MVSKLLTSSPLLALDLITNEAVVITADVDVVHVLQAAFALAVVVFKEEEMCSQICLLPSQCPKKDSTERSRTRRRTRSRTEEQDEEDLEAEKQERRRS